MAAAGRRRGRRNNGLDAADWRAIDDLDPRVSEDVLEVLATRGIAAYVQPSMDVDPITRSTTIPNRPTDRLYVDRQRVDAARDTLRRLLGSGGPGGAAGGSHPPPPEPATSPGTPGGPDAPDSPAGDAGPPTAPATAGRAAGSDLDATFAGIVAGFDRQVDPTAAPWPAAENVPGEPGRPAPLAGPVEPGGPAEPAEPAPAEPLAPDHPARPPRATGPVDARWVTEPSLLDALDTFGTDLPDEEPPERFVPPPPPPLPRLSRQTVLGTLAILAGLVVLLGAVDLPLDGSTTLLLAFAAILGGAVALILRLRPGTDPDEDPPPNDGAQV